MRSPIRLFHPDDGGGDSTSAPPDPAFAAPPSEPPAVVAPPVDAPPPEIQNAPAPARNAPLQFPTRGRIVDYTDADGDTWPAIVSKVETTEEGADLYLTAFDAVFGPRTYSVHAANYGRARGCWAWPVRG